MELENARVLMLIAEGYHDHEFWFPYYRFLEAGADVTVAGPITGTIYGEGIHGTDGLPAEVTHTIEEAAKQEYDCIYLPGGIYGPMALRVLPEVQKLIQKAMADNVIVAAICHAQWILVSADVLKGRKLTCPRDMAVDVINAGGEFVDKVESVRDGNLITAVYFGYLPEHFRMLIPAIKEYMEG